jgi:Mor family transcriptional regulator
MNSEEKILEYITISDLNNDAKYFAEFLNLDTIKKIILFAGGSTYYFPQPNSLVDTAVRKYLAQFTGELDYFAIKKIEKQFNISQKKLSEILKESKKLNLDRTIEMF